MSHEKNTKIIAFVGLAGSGKSTAVDYLGEKGFPKVYDGGFVLQFMREQGIDDTPENEASFREELRDSGKENSIVKKLIEQINDLIEAGQHRIVIDGPATWDEYKTLKKEFPGELTLVAITAPKHLRHHRLNIRPIRPLTDTEANKRDWSEIEILGKGGPIAIADYTIINEGNLELFYARIHAVLQHLDF